MVRSSLARVSEATIWSADLRGPVPGRETRSRTVGERELLRRQAAELVARADGIDAARAEAERHALTGNSTAWAWLDQNG
jgi:hypothetical protein